MLLNLVVVAALLGAGAVESRTVPVSRDVTSGIIARADSIDVALYARILKSADQRVLDTVLIGIALRSPEREIRRVAARTLSQVALRHRSDALPLLRSLTNDADSVVASTALFGLGLVRDTASMSLMATTVRARGPNAPAAAWAIGEVGRPAADTIAQLLAGVRGTGKYHTAALRELLLATSRIRPLNFASVARYLKASNPDIRWAAAYAIARQRSPGGARALLVARAPDAGFRAQLANDLNKRVVGDSLREPAVARLRKLVYDQSPYVRINALSSIATFGALARPIILHALHDRDANVRVAAAQSAGSAFDTVSSAWREAWRADTGYKVRRSLLEGAAKQGITLGGDAEWRASPDWRMRSAVVGAWQGTADTARARAVALSAVHDADARVRAAAFGALIRSDTARKDSVVQRALRAGRTDPDSMVRALVADSTARTVDTLAVERPLEWYEDAVRRVVLPSLHGRAPRAILHTVRGPITITFDGVCAPLTVVNFTTIADRHAYDNLRFHRVVPGFVAQDGDPRGDGEGGPGYAIRDELTLLPYSRGAVGMALSGPDTGGSQYFLTLTPQPHLTGHYTVFGRVTSGLAAMDSLVEGDAINSIRILW
ncbi:MAG: peptidylprolyl isomerase [Gemmatimonadaceae bacterium]